MKIKRNKPSPIYPDIGVYELLCSEYWRVSSNYTEPK